MNISVESQPIDIIDPLTIPHTDALSSHKVTSQLTSIFNHVAPSRHIIFVCIGTDRSTGDSLGPLIGSRMKKYNFADVPIFGTLDQPVHAINLQETLESIEAEYANPFVVGIDACLGQASSVGCIKVGNGPLKPGAGVRKELPSVGDIHITGIVNVGGFMEYFVLQNTRLSLVMNMAEIIAKSIYISLINTSRVSLFSNSALRKLDQ
jgi:putative sporulation protein YyaC